MSGNAVSITRETIIGNDGLYIRQDSSNEVKIWRDNTNNRIAFSIAGMSTDKYSVPINGLYRNGEQMMIRIS